MTPPTIRHGAAGTKSNGVFLPDGATPPACNPPTGVAAAASLRNLAGLRRPGVPAAPEQAAAKTGRALFNVSGGR